MPRRAAIPDSHIDLEMRRLAAAAVPARERHAYWAMKNRAGRPPVGTLGVELRKMLDAGVGRRFRNQAVVAQALADWLPEELRDQITPGSLRSGILTLLVPGGAYAFKFQRGLATALAEQFARELPAAGVRSVQFKVG